MSLTITTPAREQFARNASGLRHVGATELTYADGSEAALLELLCACTSVDSHSTEPLARATSWAERYHTHPARAGVVRAFSIPREAVVLEVGAGCGGVTRYLGEIADTVDALEPMEARALVARERTRDLAGVEVFVGEIADLPRVPAYDVVVVVGVLEYIGNGSADAEPYIAFLREIAARLRPGGSLILAIENKFGVKYLAGSPEDHTNQVFDSIEGYPRGERARTFSRRQLLELFTEAGLDARTLGAFPDYKLTRAVFDLDAVPAQAQSLLLDIPSFPSPDWSKSRPGLASEGRIWQELVEAGLSAETPNSFIVIAGIDAPSPLWPQNRVAVHFDQNEHPTLARTTDVRVTDTVTMTSTPVTDAVPPAGFTVIPGQRELILGRDLAAVLAIAGVDRRLELLRDFAALVLGDSGEGDAGESDAGAGASLSTTAIVGEDGQLLAVPATLRSRTLTVEDALARGILWLGLSAAANSVPTLWPGATTRGDVVQHFASLSMPEAVPADTGTGRAAWLDRTIERESELQASMSLDFVGADAQQQWRQRLLELLAVPLSSGELGVRDYELLPGLRSELAELRKAYQSSQDQLAEAQREVERLRATLGVQAR